MRKRDLALLAAITLGTSGVISFVRGPAGFMRRLGTWQLRARGAKEVWITTPNGVLRTLQMGDAHLQPLLLLHGLNDSAETWFRVMPDLAEYFHCVAPDLPGFGRSPMSHQGMTLRAMVHAMQYLLGTLGPRPAVVMGNSLGGWIALHLGLDCAKQVARLVLLDAAGMRFELVNPVVPETRSQTRNLLVATVGERGRLLPDFLMDAIMRELSGEPARKLMATWRADTLDEDDIVEHRLGELTVFTTVVWGSEDAIIPLEAGRRMQLLIPGSEWVLLDGTGHGPQVTAPHRVIEIVLKVPEVQLSRRLA